MIEDADIRIRFKGLVDKPGFGSEDDETGEKGEDHGDIEILQSQIRQICQRERLHPFQLLEQEED